MAGMVIIDGIKVGHLVHVTGACLGATLMWLILAIIGLYQVGQLDGWIGQINSLPPAFIPQFKQCPVTKLVLSPGQN